LGGKEYENSLNRVKIVDWNLARADQPLYSIEDKFDEIVSEIRSYITTRVNMTFFIWRLMTAWNVLFILIIIINQKDEWRDSEC